MKNPYFSVIIPTYNRQDFISDCIESVLAQSDPDFELIIVDDGSTDQTETVINSFKDDRLKYLSTDHKGVSHARNTGILNAKSDILAFLDSDDRFKPEKLETARKYINEYPEIKIFHTEEIWFRNQKLLNQKKIHKKPDGYVFDKALKLCCIGMSTSVIKKQVFDAIGLFDENMPACEDYDFWLRACAGYDVKLIPRVLTIKHGGHKNQLSKKYPAMDTYRIYAIEKLIKADRLNQTQKQAAIKVLAEKPSFAGRGVNQ
jgi:glycosyltransferase involved in cell wall biosynthesis